MAIETTYQKLLLEDFIKDRLQQGSLVTTIDIQQEIERLQATDYSVPQFVAEDHQVDRRETSSASKFNTTTQSLRQDLRALYQEMQRLAQVAVNDHERWSIESDAIEKQLIDLEDRIENLLLLTQDTEGYYSVLIDNFTDTSLSDLELSTLQIDLESGMTSLQPSSGTANRIFLEDMKPNDAVFKVRTSIDFLARSDAENSQLRNVFKQSSKSWWTSVQMRSIKPVSCELTVKLAEEPIPVSRILLHLHDSVRSSPVEITPLYSVDNLNWSQLPTNTFTQEARSSSVFSFLETEMKWVKFILTKKGPDPAEGRPYFSYQFGFKEIKFFQEGFTADEPQQFISSPLWVIGENGDPVEFEKLTLEVCERVELDTAISYFIMTSNDSDAPVDENTIWTPISPVGRANPLYPKVLAVGDTTSLIYGDTEFVGVSYDALEGTGEFVNPAKEFHLLRDDGGEVEDITLDATAKRYSFSNQEDRILNYQLKGDVNFDPFSLEVLRNVGEKGIAPFDTAQQVRGVQKGWAFEDPWYSCVVEILNPEGMEIEVGDSPIIIDDIRYTGKVESSILTGKSTVNSGLHTIQVHKSNWVEVISGADSLAELESFDRLYPHNHKLLIEGYEYGDSYPETEPRIYAGVDLFAESLMREISIFDLLNNIAPDDYLYFAMDYDAPSTHTGGNDPTKVFVVKTDVKNPDFQNERFMIRFFLINQLRKYLRLRMDLVTEDTKITPAVHSYKIKLG